MRKIVNVEAMKEKKKEKILLIRGTIVPLVIGIILLILKIRLIGLIVLAFGFIGLFFYLRRIYLKRKNLKVN